MATQVDIPNVGIVEFPDTMSPTEIEQASAKLYQDAQPKPAEPEPVYAGGIPVDMYQEVAVSPEEFNKEALKPPPPTPLQQFEQYMMAPIQKGERILKSAARGAMGLPIAFAESAPKFPGEKESVFMEGLKKVPGMDPLIEHKSEGWVENVAEFLGGLGGPEGLLMSARVPAAKALTKAALAESQAQQVFEFGIKRQAKRLMGEFEPLDIWTPKLPTVENQTLGPILKQELQDRVAQQAVYEKGLADAEARISKQTGRLIEREMGAKEKAAARLDRLSQESAMATATKEEAIAKAQNKLSTFDNTIEDPTVFNDKISSLEAQRVNSLQRIQELDQEIMSLDQVAEADKVSRLQAQIIAERGRIDDVIGQINDVNISRGMSRDQRLIARQQLQGQTDAAIKSANIAEKQAQGRLSKEAVQLSTDLQKERIRLLKQLQQKRAMRQDLNVTANKLQENLIQQEQLKQALKETAIGVDTNINWSRTFGSTNIPEQVHLRALDQAKLVDDLVKGGFVKPELADSLRQSVYSEVLMSNGIKLKTEKLLKYNFLTETFRWGKVQRRTGIPTGESVQKTIWALNQGKNLQNEYKALMTKPIAVLKKSGIDLDEQTRILQYFEKLDDGRVVFNPSKSEDATKLLVPEYRGPALTDEQIQAFSQLRDIFDSLAYEAGVPRLKRYVPIRELPEYMGIPKGSAEAKLHPNLDFARTSGQLVPGIHETNIVELSDRYLREVANKKFIGPALEDAAETLNQLHLSGLTNESQSFSQWVFDAFNLNAQKDASQVLGTYKLNQIKPEIDNFIKALPEPEGALKQIYDSLTRAMYVKLVGINPGTWVKQFLQFPTLGAIELGERWAATGTRDALNFSMAGRERIINAKKILRASLIENAPVLESEFSKAPTNVIAKGIDFLNAPARKVARRTMEKGEEFNRLQSVLASQNKFSHYWEKGGEGGIRQLLDESALTTAQKTMVSRAYLSGGIENARDIYALLITQRINFAYGLADTPAILRSEFGRLFPFLTYSRNILTRGAEAISEGRPGNLAKLIYKPLMLLAAFAGTTGRTLPPGSEPFEAITDIQKYGIAAAPQIVAKNIYKIVSPIPFTFWDEAKFKKELERKLEVFPEIGKSSPLYNELLKGFK